jgi:heme-degrading monooxygenase HmoA
MFARVTRYRGNAALLRSGFDQATTELEQLDGLSQAYFLADREHSRAMSITLWETAEAMATSAELAHARDRAGQRVDRIGRDLRGAADRRPGGSRDVIRRPLPERSLEPARDEDVEGGGSRVRAILEVVGHPCWNA